MDNKVREKPACSDLLEEVDDEFARYFRGLGYDVTWDCNRRGRWYEVSRGKVVVCQVDLHVSLGTFLADLPDHLAGRPGSSGETYVLNCPDLGLLGELQARAKVLPPHLDVVGKLRGMEVGLPSDADVLRVCEAAALEIERLRRGLLEVAAMGEGPFNRQSVRAREVYLGGV